MSNTLPPLLAVVCIVISCSFACAGDYVRSGDVLYERTIVQTPYTYYWCGRAYTAYRNEYKYTKVLNYAAPDWRQQALTLIDKQKEREAFDSTLSLLGVQGLLSPKQGFSTYQQPVTSGSYPSVAGNTLGGFTQLDYAKYGSVTAFDVNKADERAHASADAVVRMAAEVSHVSGGAVQQAINVQKLNVERVGAIAELQEMRAAYREMSAALKDRTLAEKEKLLAEAELMRSLKPQGSESLSIRSQATAAVGGGGVHVPPVTPVTPPPAPIPPAPGEGGGHPGVDLAIKYCAECHGAEKATPAGNFYFDAGIRLSETQFGGVALRLDPKAPEHRVDQNGAPVLGADGRPVPFRMPPRGFPDPNIEERRILVDFAKSLIGG